MEGCKISRPEGSSSVKPVELKEGQTTIPDKLINLIVQGKRSMIYTEDEGQLHFHNHGFSQMEVIGILVVNFIQNLFSMNIKPAKNQNQ